MPGLSGVSALSIQPFGGVGWQPSVPTIGGQSPHTWHYAGSGAIYQDMAMTTPATDNGDPVGASWNQGSDVHGVGQGVDASRLTLLLNVLNGHPVFYCDGGDYLQGAFNGGLTQPYTVFAVAQLDPAIIDDDHDYYVLDGDDAAHESALYKTSTGSPDAWAISAGAELGGIAANGNWNIWCALFNGASSVFWHNGVGQGSGPAGAENMDGLTVGSSYAVASLWIGDIAEIIIYDSNLSDADKNQVGTYLANKYGLNWTAI